MSGESSFLQVCNLEKIFQLRNGKHTAFKDINFSIAKGEILALVGESGCGKSTLGKTILSLEKPSHGSVYFDGIDIGSLSSNALRPMRRRMQLIFQNPSGSLNPRMTVEEIVAEARDIHSLDRARVKELLHLVKLKPELAARYPHELSGGECQRVSIARALAVEPEFIVCDEPLSALDMLIRKQILQLLKDLHHQLKLTYLFITHDLSTLETFADRIAVMHLGHIVEIGSINEILHHPKHPYTQALVSRIPTKRGFL